VKSGVTIPSSWPFQTYLSNVFELSAVRVRHFSSNALRDCRTAELGTPTRKPWHNKDPKKPIMLEPLHRLQCFWLHCLEISPRLGPRPVTSAYAVLKQAGFVQPMENPDASP
jgi:hypothetical protein